MEKAVTTAAPIVAIVGGGFSGAAVAARLAAHPAFADGTVLVFEPRDYLGRGLAYDTQDDAHRINVPADRMSADPESPDDFKQWLSQGGEAENDAEAQAGDGYLYPRRKAFGAYMSAYVEPFIRSGRIIHIRDTVIGVSREGNRWRIKSADGGHEVADILVIATSHPPPRAPQALDQALAGHPRYIPDPTVADALSVIRTEDRVLIVGAGLTSADVIASLEKRGHRGSITVFSRRGLRSRGHATRAQAPFGDFSTRPAETAAELTRRIRIAVRAAADEGLSWHAVLDAVRGQANTIWLALPLAEKRRLVRHLRPFWDVHRFRVAPQIEASITRGLASGRLRILAASLMSASREDEQIRVRLRHRRTGRIEDGVYDVVVVTTGPAHGGLLSSQPWLKTMEKEGWLTPDPLGLGIACDRQSRALHGNGNTVEGLYISGPLARGTFGELMGLPQVAEHAALVAESIVRDRSDEPSST